MVVYRWYVDADHVRDRGMTKPMGSISASRDSKALLKKAIDKFVSLMRDHAPENTGKARLERSDKYGSSRYPLAAYVGRATEFSGSGRADKGVWIHDDGSLEDGVMPPTVEAK